MSDRVRVRYNYDDIEAFEKSQETLRKIIQEDTGVENWIETRSLPPIGFPPPLTEESVNKLKSLDGVTVAQLEDD